MWWFSLRLFDNSFEGYREINGYSKDEILRVKNTITIPVMDTMSVMKKMILPLREENITNYLFSVL